MRSIAVSKEMLKDVRMVEHVPRKGNYGSSSIKLWYTKNTKGWFGREKAEWVSVSLNYTNKYVETLIKKETFEFEGEFYVRDIPLEMYEPSEDCLLDYLEIKRIISGNDYQSSEQLPER